MLNKIKKLFNKDSEIEPVKKERTYLNNTQILKAVQERMDKTNEKLDMISDNLSIISKYFEDFIKAREDDEKRRNIAKNISKILDSDDDSDIEYSPFVDENGKLILYKFDIIIKYKIDAYPDYIYNIEEGLYSPSKDILIDMYKRCGYEDVAVIRCYEEDNDGKGLDVKPEWVDSEEKINEIKSLPYRYSEIVRKTLVENNDKYTDQNEKDDEKLKEYIEFIKETKKEETENV